MVALMDGGIDSVASGHFFTFCYMPATCNFFVGVHTEGDYINQMSGV